MLTNNTRITVFCSKKQGRETFWFATVLDGVNYHGKDQIIVADKNVSASDEYVIRIPDSVLQTTHYVDPSTYKSLPLGESDNCYTLKKGDYVVKGLVDLDVITVKDILTQAVSRLHRLLIICQQVPFQNTLNWWLNDY